jgi:glycosyltransferase involved in cell wall biosynthesis
MRVLLVHCRYQIRGGEDECVEFERRLLMDAGVEVDLYEDDNRRVEEIGSLRAATDTVWSRRSWLAIRERLRAKPYDVIHVHNFFPLISPAVHHAARAEGCAVVQTLHNYRLLCPNGIFFRDGHVCEDCLGRSVPWPAVAHACYRGSRPGSAAIAAMLAGHRLLGTWRDKVDAFIALNEFGRRKFIEGGLPAERIVVKPNFVTPDPGVGDGRGGFALFVGRLTPEKGVATLLDAWRRLDGRFPLKIVGDGPLIEQAAQAAAEVAGIEFLGRRPLAEFYDLAGRASFFVFPSTWYEGFPRVIMECFARGTPIVASAIGPIAEVVTDGVTGVHFRPGDAQDLAAKVERVLAQPDSLVAMRAAARAEFETKYTAEIALERTLAIYRQALSRSRSQPEGHLVAAAPISRRQP